MLIPSVRKIHNTNSTKVIGLFFSQKMGGQLPWESTLERDWLLWLEYRRDVTHYVCQPKTFSFFDSSGKTCHYTPDMCATLDQVDQPIYFEVKPASIAASKRFLTRLAWQEAAIRRAGAALEVVTETVIRCEPQLTNLKQLQHYASLPALHPMDQQSLQATFLHTPSPTMANLLNACKSFNVGYSEICHELFRGQLWTDLSRPLSLSSLIEWR